MPLSESRLSHQFAEIPQFILDSDIPAARPSICVTQPRRIAAISLATRVAEEVGCRLGQTVGYTVRFDDTSSPENTRLKFVTDGTLLQEMLADPTLDRYDVVVVDEAHERSLRTDLVLGFLKQVQITRKSTPRPLKILVMSATLDAADFGRFFNGSVRLQLISAYTSNTKSSAKQLYVKGRQHKVLIKYTSRPQDDVMHAALKTVLQIHTKEPPGDILVFLAGTQSHMLQVWILNFVLRPRGHRGVGKHVGQLPRFVAHFERWRECSLRYRGPILIERLTDGRLSAFCQAKSPRADRGFRSHPAAYKEDHTLDQHC